MAWEIRAAADVAAALAGGEVVDLDAVAPPPYPPPEGPELARDRLKRSFRNIAARNRQAAELDMPPPPRVMTGAEAKEALQASEHRSRRLLARLQTLLLRGP